MHWSSRSATTLSAFLRTSSSSSCLSGPSAPTAVTWVPGPIHSARTSGSREGVTVITTSEPRTACSTVFAGRTRMRYSFSISCAKAVAFRSDDLVGLLEDLELELLLIRTVRADGRDVGARPDPFRPDERLPGRRHGDHDIGAADRLLDGLRGQDADAIQLLHLLRKGRRLPIGRPCRPS